MRELPRLKTPEMRDDPVPDAACTAAPAAASSIGLRAGSGW